MRERVCVNCQYLIGTKRNYYVHLDLQSFEFGVNVYTCCYMHIQALFYIPHSKLETGKKKKKKGRKRKVCVCAAVHIKYIG